MVDRAKWRNVADLYVNGKAVEVAEGTYFWLQALNAFEQDEARQASRAARARVTVALNAEGSDEMTSAMSSYFAGGTEACIVHLLNDRYGEFVLEAQQELESDPDWEDRLHLVMGSTIVAQAPSEEEDDAVNDANRDYVKSMSESLERIQEREKVILAALSEDALRDEVQRRYVERRANELATSEYRLHELWLATRIVEVVDGMPVTPMTDRLRIWDSKDEVRSLPGPLIESLRAHMDQVNVSVREGKDSEGAESSSGSSAPSKPAAESTESTETSAQPAAPGSST